MIIQKLVSYYEMLCRTGHNIPRYGYAFLHADFVFILNEDGTLCEIEALNEAEEHKELILPFLADHTNAIAPFFAWDNASYALGLPFNARNYKKFEAFCKLQKHILQGTNNKTTKAFLHFLASWKPQLAAKNKIIKPYYWDIIKGAHIVFRLHGQTDYLHNSPYVQFLWEEYIKRNPYNTKHGSCMLTGNEANIALTHITIKNLDGANPKGASFISFNDEAFCSYNKQQGMNAPLSYQKSFAFSTAVNYLLNTPYHKTVIGSTTFVAWTNKPEKKYACFSSFLFNSLTFNPVGADKEYVYKSLHLQKQVLTVFKSLKNDTKPETALKKIKLNPKADFCILGITPNNARLSVSFWYNQSFENFLININSHYKDMYICGIDSQNQFISITDILKEIMPKKQGNHKIPTMFTVSLLRAVANGYAYPTGLYNKLLKTIIADKEVNYIRAGFIKAYFSRKPENVKLNYKEAISVGLNKENKSVPYRLGRLFAVIEKSQQEGLGTDRSITIKDKYFATAMTAPASVFPALIKLSVYYTAKARHGKILEKQKGDILSAIKAQPLPTMLSPEEQGIFILGYYHQFTNFYRRALKSSKEA